jgi:alkylhydroperoxidase/carboxymuconolactone decarboxylase family protein YurZ
MTAAGSESDRWERGIARYHEVYGDDMVDFPRGQFEFFDLMIEHLFAEVWTRPALSIPQRRLLVIGAIAAMGRFDVLQTQLQRALTAGELTEDQAREVLVQLVYYVGFPNSGGMIQAIEAAIAGAAVKAGSGSDD